MQPDKQQEIVATLKHYVLSEFPLSQLNDEELQSKIENLVLRKLAGQNLLIDEKIAIVMAQMDSKEFTLHYQNHILHDLLVNDLSLDDGIQAIEKLSAGKHSRANVDSKLFKEACLKRAVEIQGADAGLPLSRYFH